MASKTTSILAAAVVIALGAVALNAMPRPAAAGDADVDPQTGLKLDAGWQLVRNNCSACHSLKLVTQQRGDAAQWLGLIRWMQETQNLWQFDADTEQRIVAYLAGNYPPSADRRRAPIPADLMPPNPYANRGD